MFHFSYEKYADFKTEDEIKISPCRLFHPDENYSSFLKTRLLSDTMNLWDDPKASAVLLPHQASLTNAH